MKKTLLVVLTLLLLMTFTSKPANATSATVSLPILTTNAVDSLKAQILTDRLEEIKAADKSSLSSYEKRQLRKETRSIKRELKEIGGGVYISAGALILIVLLLILFL